MPDTQRQRRQGGRPRKAAAERQSKCVFVWLTPTEHEAAREGAASSHESLSAFGAEAIRQRLGGDGPPPASADNAELAAALGQLVRIGNNLNQLTRSLNSIQPEKGLKRQQAEHLEKNPDDRDRALDRRIDQVKRALAEIRSRREPPLGRRWLQGAALTAGQRREWHKTLLRQEAAWVAAARQGPPRGHRPGAPRRAAHRTPRAAPAPRARARAGRGMAQAPGLDQSRRGRPGHRFPRRRELAIPRRPGTGRGADLPPARGGHRARDAAAAPTARARNDPGAAAA